MTSNKEDITRCLAAIERQLDWGPAISWTHQDFLQLSERILEKTGQPLSYVTLKRIWGKVAYHSSPTVNTLDVLAQFIDYTDWRSFTRATRVQPKVVRKENTPKKKANSSQWSSWLTFGGLAGIAVIFLLLFPGHQDEPQFNPDDFHFFSKTTVSKGIPNSVIFEIDARRSPFDSIGMQQSWDNQRRVQLPRTQRHHSSIYYYPGFYQAKLVVGGKVVKEHDIHIMSDGWYGAAVQEPVPVYFSTEEIRTDGKLQLTAAQLKAKKVNMQPQVPLVRMGIAQDFNGLQTDNFYLRVKLKNTFAEGSGACQETYIYIIGEGNIIKIPLVAKGCIAASSLRVMQYFLPGDKHDLSAFGVDFSESVTLEIKSIQGRLQLLVNESVAYETPGQVKQEKIKAIDFRFMGSGGIETFALGQNPENLMIEEDFE